MQRRNDPAKRLFSRALLFLLCAVAAVAGVVFGFRPPPQARATTPRAPAEEARTTLQHARPLARVARGSTTSHAGTDSRSSVLHAVRTATAEIESALSESTHPDLAAYLACLQEMRDECRGQHADLVNMALQVGGVRRKLIEDGYGLRALIAERGAKEVANELASVAGQSNDPDERLAAVLMLYFEDQLESAVVDLSLPDAAYAGLADKPITEAHFIGELHRSHAPASRAAASEFVSLARSTDDRARRAAWTALGHAHTADELLEAVGQSSLPRSDWHAIANAIAICGTACEQGLVQLVSHADRGMRMAAYEAIGLAPDGEYQALVALAMKHAPADADAAELSARQALVDGDEATQGASLE